jgi:WD40 repeat protein
MTFGDAWPLAFAPDGRTLVTTSVVTNPAPHPTPTVHGSSWTVPERPKIVTLWDATTGRPGRQFTPKHPFPRAAAMSPDGRWLAIVLQKQPIIQLGEPGGVELWDLRTGQRAAELDIGGRWDIGLNGLTFSPDGSLLIIPSTQGSQRLWDVLSSPPRAIDGGGPLRLTLDWRQTWMTEAPEAARAYPIFAPDGTRFVVPGPERGALALRETATPERAISAGKVVDPVGPPAFAPDGRTLAVLHSVSLRPLWQQAVNRAYQTARRPAPFGADIRGELVFFDATTGAVRSQIGPLPIGTHLIGFGPDGRTVWTFTYTADPSAGDGALRVQEWAVPTSWPPAWLLAVTALGLLLAVADRWRIHRPAVRSLGS